MSTPTDGDCVIIRRPRLQFDVLDVASNEIIATRATFNDALVVAAQCRGNVWQQQMDKHGRYVGDPVLVLPRVGR